MTAKIDLKQSGLVRKVFTLLALALVAVLLAGCGLGGWTWGVGDSGQSSGGAAVPTEDQASLPAVTTAPQAPQDDTDRLIISTQTLRLEVDSTTDTVEQVRRLAGEHSATITNMQVATDSDEWLYRYDRDGMPAGDGAALRGWVTVRVPAADLDAFVADVSQLGTVVYQSESTDDVTQEHIDLTARLENLRAQEARLRELVAAATNVEEMLAVEKELWRIRGEIESLDAQVQYLERQAARATVTVELTEKQPVVRPGGSSWGFVEAITNGIQGAVGVLTSTVTFLIASSPLWLTGLLVFFLVRRARRRRRADAATAASAQPVTFPPTATAPADEPATPPNEPNEPNEPDAPADGPTTQREGDS